MQVGAKYVVGVILTLLPCAGESGDRIGVYFVVITAPFATKKVHFKIVFQQRPWLQPRELLS